MSRAASVASLQAGIAEVEEEVVVAADEPGHLGDVGRRRADVDQRGQDVAQEHQRAGPVAVVPLVAHLQHLGEDRRDVDRPVRADRRAAAAGRAPPPSSAAGRSPRGRRRRSAAPCPGPRSASSRPCRRWPGPASTNIHIDGETTPAIGPTARWWWHGSRVTDAAGELALGLARGCRPAPRTASPPISAPRSGPGGAVPGDRRPGVQERPALEAERLGGGPDVDQLGAGRRAAARPPCALAASRRGSAMTRARSASVPRHRRPPVDLGDLGGLLAQGVGEAGSTPAVTTDGSRESSPCRGVVECVMEGPPRPKRGPVGTGRGGWPGRWRGTPRPRRTAGSWRRR